MSSKTNLKIGDRVVFWPSNYESQIGNIKHYSKEFRYFKIIETTKINVDENVYLIEDENDESARVWTSDIVLADKVKKFFKIEEDFVPTNFKNEKVFFK
jgi:hypothetical protein